MLYRDTLEQAMEGIPIADNGENPNSETISCYVEFYINILRLSNMYRFDAMKNQVSDKLIEQVTPYNVLTLKEWAEQYDATNLKKYCNDYIILNKERLKQVLINQLQEVDDEEERESISEALRMLSD